VPSLSRNRVKAAVKAIAFIAIPLFHVRRYGSGVFDLEGLHIMVL
jgi:hypothetical protein